MAKQDTSNKNKENFIEDFKGAISRGVKSLVDYASEVGMKDEVMNEGKLKPLSSQKKDTEEKIPDLQSVQVKQEPKKKARTAKEEEKTVPKLSDIKISKEKEQEVNYQDLKSKSFLTLQENNVKDTVEATKKVAQNIPDFLKVSQTAGETTRAVAKTIPEGPTVGGQVGVAMDKVNKTIDAMAGDVPPLEQLKVFGEGLKNLPKSLASSIITASQGHEGASVANRDWGDKFVEDAQEDVNKFAKEMSKEYKDRDFLFGIEAKDLAQLSTNLGFSMTSGGAGLATGGPVSVLPFPGAKPASWAIGTAISGKTAYEMASYDIMQEYLEIKNQEKKTKTGEELTLEEEKSLKKEFASKAKAYGLWEAIPEALGQAAGFGALVKPLEKTVGKSIATKILSKVLQMYGGELATETVTEMGQQNIRANAGLPGGKKTNWSDPKDWLNSLRAVAPQTFLLTTVMAGSGGAVINTNKVLNKLDQEVSKKSSSYQKIKEKIKQVGEGVKERVVEAPAGLSIKDISGIPDNLKPLAQEAQKYDNAEEFWKNQQKVYRGGEKLKIKKITDEGVSVTTNKEQSEFFRRGRELETGKKGVIEELILTPNIKILKSENIPNNLKQKLDKAINKVKELREQGLDTDLDRVDKAEQTLQDTQREVVDFAREDAFDAVEFPLENELRILNPDVLLNKEQTEQVYNQATQKPTEAKVPVEAREAPQPTKAPSAEVLDRYDEAMYQVMSELEISEAGKRVPVTKPTEKGGVETTGILGKASTFPQWIPENLRRSELIEKMLDHFENGTKPTRGKRLQELYKIIKKEIEDRAGVTQEQISQLEAEVPLWERINVEVDMDAIKQKMAELSKPLTGKKVKSAIREITGVKRTSAWKKKRTTTLLKERIKNRASGARIGERMSRERITSRLNEVNDMIDNSDLSLKNEGKLRFTPKQIAKIKNEETYQNALNDLAERIDKMEVKQEKRTLKKNIKKELKSKKIKPRTDESGIKRGKFTPEVQEKLETIKANIDGNRQEAMNKVMENIDKYGESDESGQRPAVPDEIAEENAMLSMVGIKDMDVAELRDTLQNIEDLKSEGKLTRMLQRAAKNAEVEEIKNTVKEATRAGRKEKGIKKELNIAQKITDSIENAFLGYRGLFEKIDFTSEGSVVKILGDKIHEARNKQERGMMYLTNLRAEIFEDAMGVENKRAKKKAYKKVKEEKTIYEGQDSKGSDIVVEMSEAEVALQLARLERFRATYEASGKDISEAREVQFELRNEDGDLVKTGITEGMEQAMRDSLSPETQEFLDQMRERWFPAVRNMMNPRFREKYGVNMGKSPNNTYVPVVRSDFKPQDESDLTLGDVFTPPPSAIPSSVRKFSAGKSTVALDGDLFTSSRRHQQQAVHFQAFDEAITDLRKIFNDDKVKSLLKEFSTEGTYERIQEKIDHIALDGPESRMLIKGVDKLNSNFVKSKLIFNFVSFFKQQTSYPAFTAPDFMNYKKLISGSLKFQENPIKWARFWIDNSDTITARMARGFSTETALAFKKKNFEAEVGEENIKLKDYLKKSLRTPTRGGDMIPIFPGITATYLAKKQQLQQETNLSTEEIEQEAIRAAEISTLEHQGSKNVEDQSKLHTLNSFTRLMMSFGTIPMQYFRQTTRTLRKVNTGKINARKAFKNLITFWVILPQIFQLAASGFKWDDDKQKRAAILGPFNTFPIVGDLVGTAYDYMRGETWKDIGSSLAPIYSMPKKFFQGFSEIGQIFKDRRLGKDYSDDIMQLVENWSKVGTELTGKPGMAAWRTYEGIRDLSKGKTKDWRRLFYSSWALGEGEMSLENPSKQLNKEEAVQYIKDLKEQLRLGNIDADSYKRRKESFLDRQARLKAVDIWRENDFEKITSKERSEIASNQSERVWEQLKNLAEEFAERKAKQINKQYKDASDEERKGVFEKQGSLVQKKLKEISKLQSKKEEILARLGEGESFDAADKIKERTFIETVKDYAKAIGTSPIDAFQKMAMGETIKKTEEGAVVVFRDTDTTQAVRELTEATSQQELDHIIPLWLGGTNDVDNLKLFSTEKHRRFTAIGNKLRKMHRSGEITTKQAKDIIKKMKEGEITVDQAYNKIGS